MQKNRKFGFTLVEVIIACSIFAIVVVGIILAINRSFIFMNNVKLSVRATNFAREGVEMVYNIRDTNRRRQSGDRDKYWLNVGEIERDINLKQYVLKNIRYQPGIYVLKEGKDSGNRYVYASELTDITSVNVEDFYSNDGFWKDVYSVAREKAKLDFGDEKYSYYDETGGLKPEDVKDVLIGTGLEFYRIMRVFGVYDKTAGNPNTSLNTSSDPQTGLSDLTNGTPGEMRFCVKVFYRSTGKHAAELCSIMTNFME